MPLPEIGLIAGTRAMLGAGIGLLLGGRLREDRRTKVGWALLITGALSTLPLALDIWRRRMVAAETQPSASEQRYRSLVPQI